MKGRNWCCFILLMFQLAACQKACDLPADSGPVALQRGVNLGNMLEAPNEGDWNVRVHEEYFDLIKQAGFDFVRLPVNWRGHTRLLKQADAPAALEIDPDFFARIDEVVCWSLSRDLPVIIDFHHYDELWNHQEPDEFVHLWKQIAEHYAHYPSQVLFELANEPNGNISAETWNQFIAAVLPVVRQSNPARDVIIGPIEWNAFDYLPTLDVPDDDHLIVTFHYYIPQAFTHQGVVWLDGSDAWLGTSWEGTDAERNEIRQDFDMVSDWASANGNPRILLGEFGSYEKAPLDSRVRWTRFVREQAEAKGFAWSYWELASGFGVYDPQSMSWREDLMQALFD